MGYRIEIKGEQDDKGEIAWEKVTKIIISSEEEDAVIPKPEQLIHAPFQHLLLEGNISIKKGIAGQLELHIEKGDSTLREPSAPYHRDISDSFDYQLINTISPGYSETADQNPGTLLKAANSEQLSNYKAFRMALKEAKSRFEEAVQKYLTTLKYYNLARGEEGQEFIRKTQSKRVLIAGTICTTDFEASRLILDTIHGTIHCIWDQSINLELIQSLQQKVALVNGIAHYFEGGLQIVEIQMLEAGKHEDLNLYQPDIEIETESQYPDLTTEPGKKNRLSEITGTWPGNESFEQLLEMLD